MKPIRFMIVQAPGGQNDVQARLMGPRLSEALGQPVIVTRLHAEMVKILNLPEVKNWNVSQGNEVIANSPQEFAVFIRQEMAKWAKVIKAAGVRND